MTGPGFFADPPAKDAAASNPVNPRSDSGSLVSKRYQEIELVARRAGISFSFCWTGGQLNSRKILAGLE